ncbi:Fumarylacetoacetate hydrolase domain-containing protein 2 [Xenoophorus captivus]|uniref:Fumarylacetoacetate hydrolase domain-containing protein 2 n=1 Tax=Xenoophorus captivus TaxID=1517983 RepID=A0ABV0R6N9_9TELE
MNFRLHVIGFLLSPILAPEKVVCVGMNYRDHCLEQNAPIPKEPIIFSKFPSAITGPYDDIVLPPESQVRRTLRY